MLDPLWVWYYGTRFDARRKQSSCTSRSATSWNKATNDAFGLMQTIRSSATSTSTSSSNKPNSSLRSLGIAFAQMLAEVSRKQPVDSGRKRNGQSKIGKFT